MICCRVLYRAKSPSVVESRHALRVRVLQVCLPKTVDSWTSFLSPSQTTN